MLAQKQAVIRSLISTFGSLRSFSSLSRTPPIINRYMDKEDAPKLSEGKNFDIASMVNATVTKTEMPTPDVSARQLAAEVTKRRLEKPVVSAKVTDIIPKLPEGSYIPSSERTPTEREKVESQNKTTENIFIAAFVISLIIGLFTLKPDYGKMKVQLSKESSELPEHMKEYVSTAHLSEAFENGMGLFGSTAAALRHLLANKPANAQVSTDDMILLIQNAGIEFQTAMQVFNAIYKLNLERESPEFKDADEETQALAYAQLADFSASLQASLLIPKSPNQPSPLRSLGILTRAHLEDLFAQCIMSPSKSSFEEFETFVLALKEHTQCRIYPSQEYAEGYRALLRDSAEHTFDGSSLKTFIASEGEWKHLAAVEILLPLLHDSIKIAKKNKTLIDNKLAAESPDVFDAAVLSSRSRLEARYLFPVAQTNALVQNLLNIIQTGTRTLAQEEIRRRHEEQNNVDSASQNTAVSSNIVSDTTEVQNPGWFAWLWGSSPAPSTTQTNTVNNSLRGTIYPSLPSDDSRPMPGSIPGSVSSDIPAEQAYSTSYPLPASSPFSPRFGRSQRVEAIEEFLRSSSEEEVAVIRDNLRTLSAKLASLQRSQAVDLSTAFRLMGANVLEHDPQYKKDMKNLPSGSPFTESVHKYVMPSARIPHIDNQYLVPVISGERFTVVSNE